MLYLTRNKMIVMKFGGTSVGSAKEILRATDLVVKEPLKKVVVVSAMGGVTNMLDSIARKVVNLPVDVVEEEVEKFCQEILEKHTATVKETIEDMVVQEDVLTGIGELVKRLKYALIGIGYLEDLSAKSLDYILSFGERMSILIVSGTLRSKGHDSVPLTGYEAGIITDSFFGQARPIYRKLETCVKENLKPLLDKGVIPVVTGFIAADSEGRITTLGRGGSDYTASLIGHHLGDVKEVQIWTDVDGIMSTDPRIVENAGLIKTISYIEAMDLAYFGAKVIHSKMIEPAMDANIPVRIKNTFNPDNEGTLIIKEWEEIEGVIKAVSMMKDIAVINLKGVGLAETPNIAATVFNALGEKNINIVMISGASEANLSLVVSKKDLPEAMTALDNEKTAPCIRNLEIIDDACVIAVVGAGMIGSKGIAARVFQSIADEDVNIIMIAQGSSEVNISFIVKESDGGRVLKTLHKRFIETNGLK